MNADTRIPDILLERYRLNELAGDEADRLTARLAHDSQLRERLSALEASDEDMRRDRVADRLETGARTKLANAGTNRQLSAIYWAIPVAAAAALVVIAVARNASPPDTRSPAGSDIASPDRIKGLEPALALYRRTAEGSETLADGAVAR